MSMKLREAEKECSVCKANFFATDLDSLGRCHKCVSDGVMPGTKEEQDFVINAKQQRENIKDMIREVLEEMKNEVKEQKLESAFAAKRCKICGDEFIPRAPAQQVCDNCKEKPKELPEKKTE